MKLFFFFSPLTDFTDNNWDYWKIKVRKFRNRPYFINGTKPDEFDVFYPQTNDNYLIVRLKELIFSFHSAFFIEVYLYRKYFKNS